MFFWKNIINPSCLRTLQSHTLWPQPGPDCLTNLSYNLLSLITSRWLWIFSSNSQLHLSRQKPLLSAEETKTNHTDLHQLPPTSNFLSAAKEKISHFLVKENPSLKFLHGFIMPPSLPSIPPALWGPCPIISDKLRWVPFWSTPSTLLLLQITVPCLVTSFLTHQYFIFHKVFSTQSHLQTLKTSFHPQSSTFTAHILRHLHSSSKYFCCLENNGDLDLRASGETARKQANKNMLANNECALNKINR